MAEKHQDMEKTSATADPAQTGSDQENALSSSVTLDIDQTLEKKLLRKLDLRIIPLLALMKLCQGMDLSNLGNAKSDGFEKDLHMRGTQYNILVSMWYIPNLICAAPMVVLVKKYGAKRILPLAMLGFGTCLMLGAATTNWGGIMATRWFLAIFESGFYSGVIFYLTTFYKRTELAGRFSTFFAANSVANAFTGLLAYGCFQIKGTLHGWQYLFLIQGGFTLLVCILAYAFLPGSAATARFLTSEEKQVALNRIALDSSSDVNSKFQLKEALKVFYQEPLLVPYMLVGIANGVPLTSVNTWLVQIVARLGYGTVRTNLLTVAPNVVGAVSLLCFAFSSDHFRNRAFHIIGGLTLTMIGFIILATINVATHVHVAYFACFMLCLGSAVPSPLLATWFNNNTPNESRRAVITGVIEGVANLSGLVSANIFRPRDSPDYIPALSIDAAFGGFGICLVLGIHLYMRRFNNRRNKEQKVNFTAQSVGTMEIENGSRSPGFRYMY